jgi:hypothetical protein
MDYRCHARLTIVRRELQLTRARALAVKYLAYIANETDTKTIGLTANALPLLTNDTFARKLIITSFHLVYPVGCGIIESNLS